MKIGIIGACNIGGTLTRSPKPKLMPTACDARCPRLAKSGHPDFAPARIRILASALALRE